jgi:Tol biopolymer transport system component
MTAYRDVDVSLRSHLEAAADRTVSDGQIEAILATTAGRRQQPAWLASLRSHPMSTTARSFGRPFSAPAWAMLIILALLIAIAAVGLTVGGWRLAPAPLPANGPIVFGRVDTALGDTVVHIARPDGSGDHVVLPGVNQCPRFSPDGRRLTIGFGVVNVDGTGRTMFTSPIVGVTLGCSTWSPDGRRLASEGWTEDQSANGIFLVDAADGSGATRLTTNGLGGSDIPGDFSPDGQHVAFVRAEPGQEAGTMWVADIRAGTVRQVIPDRVGMWVSWSPDGGWLAAGRALVPGAETRFILVRPDGSDLQSIALPPSHNWANAPTFSPDGTRLVFDMAVGASDRADIYTMKLDGTDLVQVTDTPNDNEYFADWGTDLVHE